MPGQPLPVSDHAPPPAATGHRVAIERRAAAGLPYARFVRDYVARNRPVVIEGAQGNCAARSGWTPAAFRARFPTTQVQVSYRERMRFPDFIDAMLASSDAAPGPYMYRLFIGPTLPELLAELEPFNPYGFPGWFASPLLPSRWRRPDGYLKLLMGGAGGRFPVLHYDLENAHAAITEICGDKEFVLYAPEDGAFLYPKVVMKNHSSIPDPRDVDLARFPLYARATQYHTVLHPGDMVFVPSRWWHGARALSPSISICQNRLDGSNWRGFVREVCAAESGRPTAKRQAERAYLTALGSFLAACEHWPRRAAGRGLAARLAPRDYTEAAAPSEWRFNNWQVS